jgi:hypothetical protein
VSYIRSTSNPEGLYVFGGAVGVEWYQRSRHLFTMPYELFDAAARQYVEEDSVDLPDLTIQLLVLDGNRLRVVLRWGRHEPVEMWEVTWEAIIDRYRPAITPPSLWHRLLRG